MSIPVFEGRPPVGWDKPGKAFLPNPDWDGIPPAGPGGGAEFPTPMPNPDWSPEGPGGGAEFPVPQEESGGPLANSKEFLWDWIKKNPGLIGGLVGGGAGTWVGKKTGLPGGGMLGGLAGGAIGNRVGKWLLEKYGQQTPNNEDLRDTPNPFGSRVQPYFPKESAFPKGALDLAQPAFPL